MPSRYRPVTLPGVFRFRGTARDVRKLQRLCEKTGRDKSTVLRSCLRYTFKRLIKEGKPDA